MSSCASLRTQWAGACAAIRKSVLPFAAQTRFLASPLNTMHKSKCYHWTSTCTTCAGHDRERERETDKREKERERERERGRGWEGDGGVCIMVSCNVFGQRLCYI